MKIYDFSIKTSLKFFPKIRINNIPSLYPRPTKLEGGILVGSDNGLAPTRRQPIIWTNDSKFIDAYKCHSA